jgi:transglutaminase-like putative cysteine protease
MSSDRSGSEKAKGRWLLALLLLLLPPLAFYVVLTLYGYRLLPQRKRTTVDGVTTIDDAVHACQTSGKSGWELVAYAQQLTARKFDYSRRNPWDTPARAFARGMGYCLQQAYALLQIYERLGIEAWPVHAYRVRFPAKIVHGIPEPAGVGGHAWLRVCVGNDVRDVCPGNEANRPGAVHFEPVSDVLSITPAFRIAAHLGSVALNFVRDVAARRRAGAAAKSPELAGVPG